MMKKISLAVQIKRVIGNRILFCSIVFIIIIFALTIYDLSISVAHLRSRISEKIKSIEDFAINQALINNLDTVELKIESFNESNPSFKVEWIRQGMPLHKAITWHFPFSWVVDYEISKIAGYQFGYFKVSGSFLSDTTLIYDLLFRLTLFVIIIISIISILYPLAKKIPEQLFLNPINRVIDIISNNSVHIEDLVETLPVELELLEIKILSLLRTARDYERNKATVELGHLSARLAHDIQSPLAAMEMSIQQLSKTNSQKELSILFSCIQSLRDIANNILERYRQPDSQINTTGLNIPLDDGNIERPILLVSLIELIIAQKKHEWSSQPCKLIVKLHDKVRSAWVKAAPNEVKRLLSNLLNNSYDAIPEKNHGVIYLQLSLFKDELHLQISDNGVGIPNNKISDVLNGVSLKHAGKGLGLSGANQYMKNLKGRLIIHSTIGRGTKLTLIFPRIDNIPWFPKQISLFPTVSTVVVLDDDSTMLAYWEQRMAKLGVTVKTFSRYDQAIHWLQKNEHLVHSSIFLADFELAENSINGLMFLENIQNKAHCYLVTNHGEEIYFQGLAEKAGVWLIPKSLVHELILR